MERDNLDTLEIVKMLEANLQKEIKNRNLGIQEHRVISTTMMISSISATIVMMKMVDPKFKSYQFIQDEMENIEGIIVSTLKERGIL